MTRRRMRRLQRHQLSHHAVQRSNNVFAPSGSSYAGECSDPTGQDGNLSTDPLFVDAANSDIRLMAGSASIDAGNSAAASLPATDFDANPRIADGDGDTQAVVNQGAYERLDPQPIFSDGFETGSTTQWDAQAP